MKRAAAFPFRPSLAFCLLTALMAILWIAGGASRADVLGQAVVRASAVILLIVAVIFGDRPSFASTRAAWLLLAGAGALAVLQLVPLPPSVWQALPGRDMLGEAARVVGVAQPWRPWSIVPGATVNALFSLVVPAATLVFVGGLRDDERASTPGLLLAFVAASMFLGLMQFSGAAFNNPLINDTPGVMSSSFANRNHLALFLAIGCLLCPVWVFKDGRRSSWRGPVGLGLVLLFALAILATGSRAGMAVGAIALLIGGALARPGIRREMARAPRWLLPALTAAGLLLLGALVLVSVAADRAVSIQRTFAVDAEQDMRTRALPVLGEMVRDYLPFGSGLGGFDPVFRIHEPANLLKPTYFNHAHNDFIEVVLDAGVPGLILLLAALAWWAWAAIGAWRARGGTRQALPRTGAAILFLVVLASAFDYPARSPMMMAVIALAAAWLGRRDGSALPHQTSPL